MHCMCFDVQAWTAASPQYKWTNGLADWCAVVGLSTICKQYDDWMNVIRLSRSPSENSNCRDMMMKWSCVCVCVRAQQIILIGHQAYTELERENRYLENVEKRYSVNEKTALERRELRRNVSTNLLNHG